MAKEGQKEKHKCSEQMERRTQMNVSCHIGSVKWLGDRREQNDRGRDGSEGRKRARKGE